MISVERLLFIFIKAIKFLITLERKLPVVMKNKNGCSSASAGYGKGGSDASTAV